METIDIYTNKFGVSKRVFNFVSEIESQLKEAFFHFDHIREVNQLKVIKAFKDEHISARHFNPSTGYGYSDDSKTTLGALFSNIFGTESAIVSPLIASGTHALCLCLFGLLRPLDCMISATGRPYDTILDTIGLNGKKGQGSLMDWAVSYKQVNLLEDGNVDYFKLINNIKIDPNIKLVYIQRSRGYEWRESIKIKQIKELASSIKKVRSDVIIMVDNCYGEFCEELEPTDVGADVVAGSLIKNPGAGIAPTGAYIAGKTKYIDMIANRLTAPSLGTEIGSYAASYLPFYQGIYFAPRVVFESLKGAVLNAKAFETLGYAVMPGVSNSRTDITQSIALRNKELLLKYVTAIQNASIVDSFVTPEPWDMPGYEDKVVMASGSFIQGSSIELSADAPIKPPYIAYVQGGLSYENCKLALMLALNDMNLVF
ncbi:MAG: methionine gamma-lyase family protein [Eubacteriales bacterium]